MEKLNIKKQENPIPGIQPYPQEQTVAYHEVNVNELKERKAKEKMVKTPCNHKFHFVCLKMWFKAKEVCPYCRRVLNDLAPLLEQD